MKVQKDCYVKIGARIRLGRESNGLTQKELATAVDVTSQHISDLERGVVGPSVPMVIRLCGVLNLSADYLLLGKEPAAKVG
ncbi:MAG: helix-turn-helix domain-containing protein [Oscillospiraceae bacterium]|nr:helix-turn-helix domain-containing protein [Oscillospiraceae bacterium]